MKPILTGILVAALWTSKASTLRADSFTPLSEHSEADGAIDDWNSGRFKQALAKWTIEAASSSQILLYNIGIIYWNGSGVPQDFAKAISWFEKAAMKGYQPAKHAIGNAYRRGECVMKDPLAAVQWYKQAAEKGYAPSQVLLGAMYMGNKRIPRDISEALAWHRKAAEQGYSYGQLNLATMYHDGVGVPKDVAHAMKVYKLTLARADLNDDARKLAQRRLLDIGFGRNN